MNTNIKICPICGFQTENGRVMSNHKRWQHIVDKNSEEYKSFQKKIRDSAQKRVTRNQIIVYCKECRKQFKSEKIVNNTTKKVKVSRRCCSYSCAGAIGSRNVDYSKVSKWAKEHPTGCFSTEWKLAHPESNVTRKCMSKRELEIVAYFKKHFPNDEWKQGLIDGGRKHDGVLINPDLWSKKLKVVIEYDGIWHFKEIHNQLEKKQNADKATVKFCKENGYRLIRVDEDLKISNEKIAAAVYKDNKQLELFGSERYNYLFE